MEILPQQSMESSQLLGLLELLNRHVLQPLCLPEFDAPDHLRLIQLPTTDLEHILDHQQHRNCLNWKKNGKIKH